MSVLCKGDKFLTSISAQSLVPPPLCCFCHSLDLSQCCCCVCIHIQCCRCQSLNRLTPIVSVIPRDGFVGISYVMFVLMHCFFFLFWASHVMCHLAHVLLYFPCQFLNVMLYHAVSRVCYIKLSFPRRSRCLIMFFLSASPVPITQPWHARRARQPGYAWPAYPNLLILSPSMPKLSGSSRAGVSGRQGKEQRCQRDGSALPPRRWDLWATHPRLEINLSSIKVWAAGHGRSSSPRWVSHAYNYPGAMIVISQVNTTLLLVTGWPSWPRSMGASVISDSAAGDTVLLR